MLPSIADNGQLVGEKSSYRDGPLAVDHCVTLPRGHTTSVQIAYSTLEFNIF